MNNEEELIQGMEVAAKRGAQYNIEALNEELIPTLMILTKDDRIEIAHIAAEREDIPVLLKECLITKQAKAYTLILEAWSTNFVEKLCSSMFLGFFRKNYFLRIVCD